MASSVSPSYNGSPNESSNFPWPNLEVLTTLTCEGQEITPEVSAKVEKGFFLSNVDQKWTCYRRNYFSVVCHFDLHPSVNNGRLSLKRANASSSSPPELVQAMGMRLSAAVDGPQGKSIELVQHTPKRDNGPKNKIDVVKVSPSATPGRNEHTISPHGVYQVPLSSFHPTGAAPGPYLPLQNSAEGNSSSTTNNQSSSLSPSYPYTNGTTHMPTPGQSTSHTFERVQFKQATANNGKRRASQQYFHLMVELFADVRKDGSDTPSWIKVAQRVSEKIVVRGRSPSHYQNEGQNGQAARGGGGGGGNGYHAIGGATYGSLNSGGFRSAIGAFGNSVGGSGGYHRTGHYGYNGSSGDSASSPESVEGGAADSDHHMDTMMADAEGSNIQDYDGYRYYPSTIYEGVPPQLPVPKFESDRRSVTEPRHYGFALKTEYSDAIPGPQWQEGGCGRFQGVETSCGYYPTALSVGTPNYS